MSRKRTDLTISDLELRNLYVEQGLSMKAIGDRLGIGASSVLGRLRKANVLTRPRRTALTRELLEAAIGRGEWQAEIARGFGVSDAAVAHQMKHHGLVAPKGWHGARGSTNPGWKGGRTVNARGYVMLLRPDHPYADKRGRVMEHRLVVEAREGRYLLPGEVVHHMNHVTGDNRPENLMLLPDHSSHMKEHAKARRATARS